MRICACTETSSAETGSSATTRLRVERQGAGDADALPLAAAEGVREAAHVFGPQADQLEQLRHAVLALLRFFIPFTSSGSPTMSSSVMRGLSDENGSWKIICISRRSGCSLLLRQRRDVHHLALFGVEVGSGPPVGCDGPQDAARGGRLAAAALAHQRQRLALADGEADVIHGADVADDLLQEALPDGEELVQALDIEQHLALSDGVRMLIHHSTRKGSSSPLAHRPTA